ncbi:MAG: FixH family protein, partial [Vicinamibacterales bacterium]
MSPLAAALFLMALLSAACGQSGGVTEHQTEAAKVRSGGLDVVLLSREAALSRGQNTATIEFRSTSDNSLVHVGTVKASATMSMPGMAPMMGPVVVQPTYSPGRYMATSDIS